jgi:hypothetical protein
MLLSFSFAAEAQQTKKVARIGFLGGTGRGSANNPRSNFTVLRQALRDLGYIEGQNDCLSIAMLRVCEKITSRANAPMRLSCHE